MELFVVVVTHIFLRITYLFFNRQEGEEVCQSAFLCCDKIAEVNNSKEEHLFWLTAVEVHGQNTVMGSTRWGKN